MATKDPADGYLVTEKLVKRFDEAVAVDDVSLSIGRGEIFALLGSSGCGKSTLLRMLAGFEKPTSGRVLLAGQDVAPVSALRPADEHDVPVLCAVSASGYLGKRRVRTQARGPAQGGDPPACRRNARPGATRAVCQAQAAPAVRRPAAACGIGAQPGQATQTAAARRTPGRAGQETARADPVRTGQHHRVGRRDLCHGDPRPGRSHDHGQPDRGHEQGQGAAGRLAKGGL